jgi:hypothetical protein
VTEIFLTLLLIERRSVRKAHSGFSAAGLLKYIVPSVTVTSSQPFSPANFITAALSPIIWLVPLVSTQRDEEDHA